jgi:excisionase family DNA binding protein
MHNSKPPPVRPAAIAAAANPHEAGGLVQSLTNVIEELLRPMRTDLESIRSTLNARRKSHYTVEEVAELTGRSAYTVRRWITEKRLKAIRIAGTGPKGRLLISRDQIDVLIGSALGGNVPDAAV